MALLVLKVVDIAQMHARSQYLSHMIPIWVGLFSLGQGDGCAQLDRIDLEEKKLSAHVACFMEKKRKSPKTISSGPSNFEGNGLHLGLLLKLNPTFGEQPQWL